MEQRAQVHARGTLEGAYRREGGVRVPGADAIAFYAPVREHDISVPFALCMQDICMTLHARGRGRGCVVLD